ncbi:MAG TPA: low molecular weight protein-tyrosine-phosphatase [Saprospiraceae bacterium]|nr:low molecular weight protein-tyrosine-phosphatase [Saprospiraceae bacterium]
MDNSNASSQSFLMVCLGNICRSPLAEGILKDKIYKKGLDWKVDSAGTSGFHNGENPDPRSIQVAKKNNIDISRQISRKITVDDMLNYDHIIVMDSQNYQMVNEITGGVGMEKVSFLLDYLYKDEHRAVPDPYYDGGFDYVFDIVSKAVDALIETYSNSEQKV